VELGCNETYDEEAPGEPTEPRPPTAMPPKLPTGGEDHPIVDGGAEATGTDSHGADIGRPGSDSDRGLPLNDDSGECIERTAVGCEEVLAFSDDTDAPSDGGATVKAGPDW
jgi:hypothetical protein